MTTLHFCKQKKGRTRLAALIAAHLDATVEYLGTPSFAYQIGDATLDRDWVLHLPGTAHATSLLEAAQQAGFSIEDTEPACESGVEEGEAQELGLTLVFPTTDWDDTVRSKLEASLRAKGALIAKALEIPATPIHLDEKAGTAEFPWFPVVPDLEVVEAASVLIARIIAHAQTATRISSTPPPPGNDKYAMRCWLLRLGMIGDGYKPTRRVLLRNLDGNAAWKTMPQPIE